MMLINQVFGISLLLFSGLHLISALTVTIEKKEYKVARGDNVIISCAFTPQAPGSPPSVIWTAHADKPTDPDFNVASIQANGIVKIGKNYKDRATMDNDFVKGVSKLQIKSVTNTDTRTYACKVSTQNVDEEDESAVTNLIVLVAPSTPICKIVGVAEFGQNINLTCRSEEGSPPPTYKWQSNDVTNKPRPNPPKATDQNGILSLYNISSDTSGYFFCTSTNEIRSATCNITLAVVPPSMNMATIGIIGGVIAAVVILGVIIFCCCRRRKNKPEEYEMGKPEDDEYTDKEPIAAVENRTENVKYEEERRVQNADRRDPRDDRSERSYDRRSDYDDKKDRNSDRRDDNGDRRDRYDKDDRYDDRRDRYDDRRDRYDDRSDRYDDRRERYDDRRDRSDDRRDRYDDRRYDDRRDRYDSDQYSERYDSRDRPPSVPPNKPRD